MRKSEWNGEILKWQKKLEGVLFEKNHLESDLVIYYLSSVSRLSNFVAIATSLMMDAHWINCDDFCSFYNFAQIWMYISSSIIQIQISYFWEPCISGSAWIEESKFSIKVWRYERNLFEKSHCVFWFALGQLKIKFFSTHQFSGKLWAQDTSST